MFVRVYAYAKNSFVNLQIKQKFQVGGKNRLILLNIRECECSWCSVVFGIHYERPTVVLVAAREISAFCLPPFRRQLS